MKQVSSEFAEHQVVSKYHKLYGSLVDLVRALNVMEPGGTLLDDVTFTTKEDGKIQVSYVATPIQVTINTPQRKVTLKVIEYIDGRKPFTPRRIQKQERVAVV